MPPSQQYMPGAQMDKDYDPLNGIQDDKEQEEEEEEEEEEENDNGYDGEGDDMQQPGGVSFDIPRMDDPEMDNDKNDGDTVVIKKKKKKKKSINMDEVPVIGAVDDSIPVGNLSTFLDDTTLLRTFLKFLKKKTDDYKLLEFYLMAGQFKTYAQDPKSTRSAQRNNAKLIIETFFLPDSKKFLERVQGMTRHEAMSQFLTAGKTTDLDPTLFDRARQEVKSELISRVFPIFMQSDRYKKLVNEGKVRPP